MRTDERTTAASLVSATMFSLSLPVPISLIISSGLRPIIRCMSLRLPFLDPLLPGTRPQRLSVPFSFSLPFSFPVTLYVATLSLRTRTIPRRMHADRRARERRSNRTARAHGTRVCRRLRARHARLRTRRTTAGAATATRVRGGVVHLALLRGVFGPFDVGCGRRVWRLRLCLRGALLLPKMAVRARGTTL